MCKVTTNPFPRKAIAASKKSKHERRVHFGQVQAKVFHQPLSRSDKQAIWYTGSEFKQMNREVKQSLRQELYYGFDPNDTERTWRGLEHIREGVPNAKLERRRRFVRGLLYFHKTMGVTDPEELSAIAITESNIDQVRAQQFADYDAYEASCVYYEPIPYDYPQQTPESELECISFEDYEVFQDIPRSKCVSPTHPVIFARTA